jgi:hypothetical protein
MFHSAGHSFFWGADNELAGLGRIGSYSRCSFLQRFLAGTDYA